MERLESLAATKPFRAAAGVGLADMTLAAPARTQGMSYGMNGHSGADCLCGVWHESEIGHRNTAVAVRAQTIARRSESSLVELKSRRRFSEDEIVRAAIAVIFVALVATIALSAGAILTMA